MSKENTQEEQELIIKEKLKEALKDCKIKELTFKDGKLKTKEETREK